MNNYLLKNARLYRNHCFEETDILVENGYIQKIQKDL